MRECPICLRCYSDEVLLCPADNKRLIFGFVGEPLLKERYILEKCIGVGGMGKVYKARHLFLKTEHAIKVILPQNVGQDPELVRRFRQEAVATAAIRHPNIVAVTDFDVINGETPFLVMEFVKGRSLDTIIAEEGPLPLPKTLEIMEALCNGVGEAHRLGIIHRDLKPLNIILQEDVSVSAGLKILDFGLAKIRRDDMFGSLVLATTTGVIGSPYYMAPEQWSEEQPDARTDIYALGIILYQLLTGAVPFKGPSLMTVMKQHLFSPPPPLQLNTRGISAEVEKVVQRSLAKERAHRPGSAEEFWEELTSASHYELLATRYSVVTEANSEVVEALEVSAEVDEPVRPEVTEVMPLQRHFIEQAAILDAALQAKLPEPPSELDETLVRPENAFKISAGSHTPLNVESSAVVPVESDPNVRGRLTRNLDEMLTTTPTPPIAETSGATRSLFRKPLVLGGLGLAGLLLALTLGWGLSHYLAPAESQLTPKVSTNQFSGNGRSLILDYYIQIENGPRISDKQTLRKGNKLKYHFISRETGFLYLLAHQGNALQTFLSGNPASGTNVSSNRLEAGADFTFPGGDIWLTPQTDAKEMVYTVIFSEKPLSDYEFLNVNEIGKNLSDEEERNLLTLRQSITAQGQITEIETSATNNWLRNVSLPAQANPNRTHDNRIAIFEIVLRVQ